MKSRFLRTLACSFFLISIGPLVFAQTPTPAPEHFYNDPANINTDPSYVPGDYPMEDTNDARTYYQIKKEDITKSVDPLAGSAAFTLDLGEISFKAIKNESAEVMGYFRNYFGVVQYTDKGFEKIRLIIDINSLDTAVPGRNNRILKLFFQSMKPELGTSEVVFDSFDGQGKSLAEFSDGQEHPLKAVGKVILNGTTQKISAILNVTKNNDAWKIETQEPISLLISDFNFGDRPYVLMKECNHKAIGNHVTVKSTLYFK